MTPGRAVSELRPWIPAVFWSAATVGMGALVGRYWIPLDDGTLAQSAERVLGGQLPHVDFGDPYSGLNAMLGALAFRALGVGLASLRVPLVVGFAAWLPAVWLIARRLAPFSVALAATTLAALASVPAYPAAMPTWFALFAATWGLLFLHVYLDRGGRRWLAAAGGAAGVAVLFKVVGLYFLAACLLSVAWHRASATRGFRTLALGGCGAFLALLGGLVLPGARSASVAHFFVPAVALCAAVVARAWSDPEPHRADSGVRPALVDGVSLLAGFLVPVALFLIPYVFRGAVAAWIDGVFLRPSRRLDAAASAPAAAWTLLTGVTWVAVVALTQRVGGTSRRRAALALAAVLALGFALDDALDGAAVAALWYSLRTLTPAVTVWGAWRLGRRRRGAADGPAFAALAAAGLWSLVQFPYAAPAYFFYVAPLTVLATLAVVGSSPRSRGPDEGGGFTPVVGVLAVLFAYLAAGYAFGVATAGERPLPMDRGGILVSSREAEVYADLVETIAAHVGGGSLWAGPDAPEVYFLSGLPNRTPILYEFLSGEEDSEPAALRDPDVTVAVVNERPLFSPPLDADTRRRLRARFPESRAVGSWVVRWGSP